MKYDSHRMAIPAYSGRDTILIAVLALVYFLAHVLALQFPDTQRVLAAVWPAGGIGLAALLLSSRRKWPVILLVLFLAGNSANLLYGRPAMASVGFMTANLLESLVSAWVISRFCGASVRFSRVREVSALILCALAVNSCTALIGAGTATLTGGAPFGQAWATWWVSDGLGIMLIAPLILAWSSSRDWFSGLQWGRVLEWGLFLAIWCAFVRWTFQPYDAGQMVQPYMLVGLLAWPALRLGQRGVTVALVVAAAMAVTSKGVVAGPLLWGGADPVTRLLSAQLFIAFATATALLLATGYSESRSAEQASRESLRRLQISVEERNAAEQARQAGQALLTAIQDATSDCIYAKDMQGRYLLFNRAAERFTGKTAASVLGHDDFFLFPPAEAAAIMEGDRRTIDRGCSATYEEVMTSADGIITTFLSTKGPMVDAKGTPCGLYGVSRDITARKRAEEALRRERMMLARTESTAHVGSWEWEIATDTVTWSEELFRIFQRDPREGAPSFAEHPEIYPPDDMARLRKAVEAAVAGGTPYELELRAIRKDGETRVCAASGFAEMSPDGRAVRLFGSVQDITERKRAEMALRESEEKFRALYVNSPDALYLATLDEGRIIAVNDAFEALYGYARDEVIGRTFLQLNLYADPDDRAKIVSELKSSGRVQSVEVGSRKKSGEAFSASLSIMTVMLQDQVHILGAIQDITGRKRAETEKSKLQLQLAQAQKMESIGRLAGGLAHDFNNLLTVINGFSALALQRTPPGDPRFLGLTEVLRAGEKATGLVRQLLAFSRKQALQTEILDLNATVVDMERMLSRLVGEDVEVVVTLAPAAVPVLADRHQIEQVIMNLAVNARDAMPGGGTLTMEIGQRHLESGVCGSCHEPIRPGTYAKLTVRDTGTGMEQHTIEHLFEPFFTTKTVGEGTGLGLPTVEGIVHQSGGHVAVESQAGKGSAFHIYLPAARLPAAEPGAAPVACAAGGQETILLVEDQEEVRQFVATVLRAYGYEVVQAGDAAEAVRASAARKVDLLVTDIVMPKMSGVELARRLQASLPGLKTIYISGYSEDTHGCEWGSLEGACLLQKPFEPEALAAKVREVLDRL